MKKLFTFVALTLMLNAEPNLLFYCGITMVPAAMEAKAAFEKQHHCTITIIQGGSKDLYKSIEATRRGDLFLPGKSSYIDQCRSKGYVLYQRFVGYNRLALFVPKGNPGHTKNLDDLLRGDLLITLGNPSTCSIGKAAEATLLRYGGNLFLKKVKHNLSMYAADSRDMNNLLSGGQADLGLNWIASSYTQKATGKVDVLPISDLYAPPQELVAAVLRFSPRPELSRAFVDYLSTIEGKSIMQKHGFSHE